MLVAELGLELKPLTLQPTDSITQGIVLRNMGRSQTRNKNLFHGEKGLGEGS